MVKQELRGVTAQLTAAVCDGMTWHRASQLLMQHSKRLAVLEDERLPPQWEEVHPVGGCAACTPVADENWSA